MRVFHTGNIRETYVDLLDAALNHGYTRHTRGSTTRDLGPVTVVLHTPDDAVPTDVGRQLNLRIGAAETVQLIGGVSDLVQLDSVTNGRFSAFADHGRLQGAYGPRTRRGLRQAITALTHDDGSRQAVVPIWREGELTTQSSDVPCTVALNFTLSRGALDMNVIMRSNDLWLGFPYDVMMFTQLQHAVATALDVPFGVYTHTTWSMHLYESNFDAARRVVQDRFTTGRDHMVVPTLTNDLFFVLPTSLRQSLPIDRWSFITELARSLVVDTEPLDHVKSYDDVRTDSLTWFRDLLQQHRSGNRICEACRYVLDENMWDEYMPTLPMDSTEIVQIRRRITSLACAKCTIEAFGV